MFEKLKAEIESAYSDYEKARRISNLWYNLNWKIKKARSAKKITADEMDRLQTILDETDEFVLHD